MTRTEYDERIKRHMTNQYIPLDTKRVRVIETCLDYIWDLEQKIKGLEKHIEGLTNAN